MVGELGIFKSHRTIHEDLMATVHFHSHGLLEILMDSSVITLLEARAHWTETGPKFTLGDIISTLATPVTHGVVHGFVTQADGTAAVLIWTDTDKYAQYRPDQIQLSPLGLLELDPLNPMTQSAGTCLSGCTLLASASGGIPMRKVRAGTSLLNAKGKPVKVTHVYFSRESAVMVQTSANCHVTLTHPLIDTKTVRRKDRNRPRSAKFVTTAAEWYTRRHTDNYRFPPPNAPHPMSEYLHHSSPHNHRRSGDMWGFSTAQNQAVRSFDDSSCLICPIGHVGWAQVDIAKALLSCWGRTRHLPDPRPDLDELQEQMVAIHAFLSKPDTIRKLATKRVMQQASSLASLLQPDTDELPIEFTSGHVQLEWASGRWTVHDWKPIGTSSLGRAWIQPEENLLSALIRSPTRPEDPGDPAPTSPGEANLERGEEKVQSGPSQDIHIQSQAGARQECPHESTEIIVGYLHRIQWRTPFLRRLRSINKQWQTIIDSLPCAVFDFSTTCQSHVQPRDSFRLGMVRHDRLIYHNREAYERLPWDDFPMSGECSPDRGLGPSGAQMLNNLRLLPMALPRTSPLRDSLVHLNINGCQSINKSAIDALLRLTHGHLPKLQRIHMVGLRLELCQQAAKSFLREKLNKLDSLGTMGAFTLGSRGAANPNGDRSGYTHGQDLTATHLTHWLREHSREARTRTHRATTIANLHPL